MKEPPKKKALFSIATVAFFLASFISIHALLSKPIECTYGTKVTPETQKQEALKKQKTIWHTMFFAQAPECRKLSRTESIEQGRSSPWDPDSHSPKK